MVEHTTVGRLERRLLIGLALLALGGLLFGCAWAAGLAEFLRGL